MIFGKKKEIRQKCEECGSRSNVKYSFCPHCGNSFLSENETENFGLLGKDDFSDDLPQQQSFGITDKFINSIMSSMMRSLDKQFKEQFKDIEKDLDRAEIKTLPNGIRIKISSPIINRPQKIKQVSMKKEINDDQLKKMSEFPREKAKTNVKRIGDKVIYELTTPGLDSPHDVFVSKLESGYEIKAIGSKKIYINSIPINLPIKRYSILKDKLFVEFTAHDD